MHCAKYHLLARMWILNLVPPYRDNAGPFLCASKNSKIQWEISAFSPA